MSAPEPRNYADLMMADGEQECEDEARALGWRFPPLLPPSPKMVEAFQRLARAAAGAGVSSDHYYLLTGKGRVAAERIDAAARAQLERTKETR